jgi:histidine triad (HIT) family protein
MSTIFTKIIAGEIPCHKIAEDERFLAFLDIRPVNPGHTLVIPKKETDYIFDMDDRELADLMVFAKRVARAVKKAVPCIKVGVMVAGLEVRHAHVHLIPILESLSELSFSRAKAASPEELTKLSALIKSYL